MNIIARTNLGNGITANSINLLLTYLFYALIIFIPLSNSAIEILSVAIIVFFIIKKIVEPEFGFLNSRIYLFLALFITFSALSIFNSGPYLVTSIRALVTKWCQYIALFTIAHDTFRDRPEDVKRVVGISLAICFIVCADTLFNYFKNVGLAFWYGIVQNDWVSSIFGNKNSVAAYVLPISLIATALLADPKPPVYNRRSLVAIYPIFVCALMATSSRGALLGLCAGSFLCLLLLQRYLYLTMACLFTVVSAAVIGFTAPQLFDLVRSTGDIRRFNIIVAALRMVGEHPFLGLGVGTFAKWLHNYSTVTGQNYAHSSILQILAETGILSMMSLISFLAALLFAWVRRFKRNKDLILLGFICAVTGFLTHSMVESHLYSLRLSALFWVLLGVGNAYSTPLSSARHCNGEKLSFN